jgi:2-(1,2-epoxy-1,2-dihydrophenyl)acetyl-CoA isomerase
MYTQGLDAKGADILGADEERVLAESCANAPPRGVAMTKAAIRGSGQHTLAQQLDVERDAQRELGRSSDYREDVAAFSARRAPVFR